MAPASHFRFAAAGTARPERDERLLAAGPGSRRVLAVLLGTIMVAALAAAVLPLIGYRPLVVRSGSMTPALKTGDLIVTHLGPPSSVRVGDIVTFSDRSRGGALVTHRVMELSRQGRSYSFVTKGDSNSGFEEWTIGRGGEVGRLAFRVPKLGFAVASVSGAGTRAALVGFSLALLAAAILRRIWS